MIKAVLLDYWGVIQTDKSIVWMEQQAEKFPLAEQAIADASAKIDLDQITIQEYYEELAVAVNSTPAAVKAGLNNGSTINHPLLKLADELRAKNINVSLLSNDGSYLRGEMEKQDIAKHFDVIFLSGEIGSVKPDQKIYNHVITELGLQSQEIIFFDDRQTNVNGARQAGMRAELYASVSQVRQLLSDLL